MSMNQLDADRVRGTITTSMQEHWVLFLVEGIILVILGLAAIIVPPLATLAVAIFLGWLFLISGIVGLVTTFMMRHAPGFWWSLVSAVLGIAVGIVLIGWPVSGAVSLTLVLIVFFIIEGAASIMFALEHRRELSGRWGWMLASGIVDLILAGIIFAGLPLSAAWAIGLLAGINLVFGGSALIAMALHARSPDAQSARFAS
ncbi:MAG: HdeD family acid-resistance protein [Hyphomicrobiales bacterium]|nr:HdeD family acid-resistance protein [Hyphomicrobiales bacterium]MBV9432302.1 HdeD family acid-resistance protein [Hyphomicrobiales bacterium]MBV9741420.1 HdeD family acid-resistance protein [Hyphomicrobiales bacterium]